MIPGILKYFQGLLGVVIRTGRVPVLSKLVQAHKAGDMSRREFFRSIVGMGKEAKLQGDYMNSLVALDKNKRKGSAILRKNKHVIEKMGDVRKEVIRRKKISRSRKIFEQAKKMSLNPSYKSKVKDDIAEFDAYEDAISEGFSKPSKNEIAVSRSFLKNLSNKELAKLYQSGPVEGMMGYEIGSKKSSLIWDKVNKKFGITEGMRKNIQKARTLEREGFEGDDSPIVDYFKTRDALQKHTGMSHKQIVQYNDPNYLRPQGKDVSFPGIDVAPKSEDVKKIANPVKEAWDEIVKAFYEGMTD